jgi:hypothetical protein
MILLQLPGFNMCSEVRTTTVFLVDRLVGSIRKNEQSKDTLYKKKKKHFIGSLNTTT